MKIGTKSILYGIHCPPIHYIFTLWAWIKLYGIKLELLDPRLHFCILLHDIGYWQKETLDGADGMFHPCLCAQWAGILFGERWYWFCLLHSGKMVDHVNKNRTREMLEPLRDPSKLYYADKLSSALYPRWLYRLLSGWSGEWVEYCIDHLEKKTPIDKGSIRYHDEIVWYQLNESNRYHFYVFETWHKEAMEHMKRRAYDTT